MSEEDGAPIRISYPALVMGPDDPGMSVGNNGIYSFFKYIGLIISSGICIDVRDLATVHARLLELPNGAHRYAATGEMLHWDDVSRYWTVLRVATSVDLPCRAGS